MEQQILEKLRPLVERGAIEPAMFFRVCAVLGVSFAAAMALAASSPAFAEPLSRMAPAPSSYADLVAPEILTLAAASALADEDPYWVKKSGEPFSKFDKAP